MPRMSWTNVRLVLQRELRDQLRDQRTLFTIVILPLLLYPLIGMAMMQVSQFLQEHPSQVLVVGADHLPESPPLIAGEGFHEDLLISAQYRLLQVSLPTQTESGLPEFDINDIESMRNFGTSQIRSGEWDAVLVIPPHFREAVASYQSATRGSTSGDAGEEPNETATATLDAIQFDIPIPQILVQAARDKSRMAGDRLDAVLRIWRRHVVDSTGITQRVPSQVFEPFAVATEDVSEQRVKRAAAWAKILPFVLVIWALTGAFYPAVDLCAGEKERGTLETLLSSPARRSEIVVGKLLTIMAFSMATSLLNLVSMTATGLLVMKQLPAGPAQELASLGPPPVMTLGWLVMALVPVSALFGALALALATLSRSTKEGQYYLMPLMLVSMPLIMLSMLPSTEFDLGTSLIPITGLLLLLRSLIEGDLHEALRFVLPVGFVTGACCLLSIRWAIDQFNRESVLFRDSERFHLGYWLVHLVRDRGDTPTAAEAVLCAVVILILRFFSSFVLPAPNSWNTFFVTTVVIQLAMILTPALLMTTILTQRPKLTLMLKWPSWLSLTGAAALAVLLHPAKIELAYLVQKLYPISPEAHSTLARFGEIIESGHWTSVLFAFCILPALCEELAFRGFILSGLRRTGHRWVAILVSSVFFGVAHGVIQQSIPACLFGMVLGYLAIQSGSIWVVVTFHAIHNGLGVWAEQIARLWRHTAIGNGLYRGDEGLYHGAVVGVTLILAMVILYRYRTMPIEPTEEEKLQSALERQAAFLSPGS